MQTQDSKWPQQDPADDWVGGWWSPCNLNVWYAKQTGSKDMRWDQNILTSCSAQGIWWVCLECTAVRSLHWPAVGTPPLATAASCRTTACLWGAKGSTIFLLTGSEWWCFHFDDVSSANFPPILALWGKIYDWKQWLVEFISPSTDRSKELYLQPFLENIKKNLNKVWLKTIISSLPSVLLSAPMTCEQNCVSSWSALRCCYCSWLSSHAQCSHGCKGSLLDLRCTQN